MSNLEVENENKQNNHADLSINDRIIIAETQSDNIFYLNIITLKILISKYTYFNKNKKIKQNTQIEGWKKINIAKAWFSWNIRIIMVDRKYSFS